jgi:hypothetical protein
MQSAHEDPEGAKNSGAAGSAHSRGRADEVRSRPLSALPSVQARALAFAAIIVAGICGALIGWSFVDLQCHGNCTVPDGGGGVVGAVVAAGGVAVVSVLVLRAMGEWKTISEERALTEATHAAVAGASRTPIATGEAGGPGSAAQAQPAEGHSEPDNGQDK